MGEASGSTRRSPSSIQSTLEGRNAETLQSETVARYGFRPNAQFATDMLNYTRRQHKGMPTLLASKDVATVRAEYRSLYGEDISDQYAADLIAYFEKES
jgi:hypothetical protein